ncbi:MAG: tRNA (adenosine(37)-N6)-threonylcarbamoyltransferase complex ATPase subunit type 1 TsaE [Patescibacteria group bacterium]|nr:tRNA (adenosine(37)-N6)-threonylcarbamoyltransferase complex ATPase subunit type 1 TsaE [Patescibacteria group bacterium]
MARVALGDLKEMAREVLTALPHKNTATTLALMGELGAGKTTFVQALAKELGVEDTVQSPTYVLMKKYQVASSKYQEKFQTLIHIDAYRLEKPKEFAALKPESFLKDPKNLVCIEWPERLEGALPVPDVVLKFSADPPAGEAGGANERERHIAYEKRY